MLTTVCSGHLLICHSSIQCNLEAPLADAEQVVSDPVIRFDGRHNGVNSAVNACLVVAQGYYS